MKLATFIIKPSVSRGFSGASGASVEMTSYGSIFVMGYVKKVSLKSCQDTIFYLSHILNVAVSTCIDINKVRASAVHVN